MASVRFGDAPDGRQAQPGATRLGREERREELVTDFRRNACARVSNIDVCGIADCTQSDGDLTAALHGLRRVQEQVLKRDLQQLGIGLECRKSALRTTRRSRHAGSDEKKVTSDRSNSMTSTVPIRGRGGRA